MRSGLGRCVCVGGGGGWSEVCMGNIEVGSL